MTVIANTFTTGGTGGSNPPVGNRQEIDDIVSRITPEDTPIYSMIDKGKTRSTSPEWETDTLRAPAANAQLEGDEYTFNAITPAVRLKNYTQIFRQGWVVSNTQEAVSNVGNVEKSAEKKIKSGIEVRKDIELSIVTVNASVAGQTRVSASLSSWLTTNVARFTSGTNGGYNTGTGIVAAEGVGTLRAFTKTLMDTVMGQIYTSGGNPRSMVVSPYIKSVFVTFMSDTNVAPFRYAVTSGSGKNTIISNADVYEGPFGKVNVVPNRVMATSSPTARHAFFIDPELLEWTWLRPLQEDPNLAKTHDAVKGVIIGEGCLKVRNEAGLGMVADLFGLTATT